MAQLDLTAIAASSITTPASGVGSVFFDTTNKLLKTRNDAGFVSGRIVNFSSTNQTPAAATRTYITGSALAVPTEKLQIGTLFRWRIAVTKDANGTAASTYDICFGTAGTTADTARVSFTKPAGTAAADEGFIDIYATVRGPLSASGVVTGEFIMLHNGNTAGHMTIPMAVVQASSAGFDVTVANLIVGVCVTSGAADALTITQVQAEAINL